MSGAGANSGATPAQLFDPLYYALAFMITSSTALVYIGSSRSLARLERNKNKKVEDREQIDRIQLSEAKRFPLVGSAVLLTLYLVIKFVPKWVWMTVLAIHLGVMGVVALAAVIKPLVGASFITGSLCVGAGIAFFITGHWVLNNIFAYALCIGAIEMIHLQSCLVSATLLVGLFFYDIFWVFGTDVMVTVAKNIQGPIKIVFPKNISDPNNNEKSLLGLGDIVIPGFFIAQMLRFGVGIKRGRKYFFVALVAYVFSLLHTMYIMVAYNHAQPALLYIVPWLLICVFGTAAISGDLKALWNHQDEEEQPAAAAAAPATPKEAVEPAAPSVGPLGMLKAIALDYVTELKGAAEIVFGLDEESHRTTNAKSQ